MPDLADLDLSEDDLGVEVGVNEEHTCFTVVVFARKPIPIENVSALLHEIADGILSGDHKFKHFEEVDSH